MKKKTADADLQRRLEAMLKEAGSGNVQFKWLDAIAERAGYERKKTTNQKRNNGVQSKRGDIERAALRRREILDLRIQGLTLDQIGEKFGMYRADVCRAIWKEIDAVSQVSEGKAKHLRGLSLARLDRMLHALWWKIQAGDVPAVMAGLKIEERRARLLGIDLQPEPIPQVTLNILNINDPRVQVLFSTPEAIDVLHRITESGANNGHGLEDSAGGDGGLEADAGDDGGEAEPGLPPLPARQDPE